MKSLAQLSADVVVINITICGGAPYQLGWKDYEDILEAQKRLNYKDLINEYAFKGKKYDYRMELFGSAIRLFFFNNGKILNENGSWNNHIIVEYWIKKKNLEDYLITTNFNIPYERLKNLLKSKYLKIF